MKTKIISGVVMTLIFGSILSCSENAKQTKAEAPKVDTVAVQQSEVLPEVANSDEALARIKEGNERYIAGKNVFPDLSASRKHEEVQGQHPFATVIGCSDSRVPVELLFDQGIGDLFVVRTAGNSIDDKMTMGSLDYSLEHLHVKLVVVLGHEKCGGITGAIAPVEKGHHDNNVEDDNIEGMLDVLKKGVKGYEGKTELVEDAITANVKYQVELIKKSPLAKRLIEEGKLKVVGAKYELERGDVVFLDN